MDDVVLNKVAAIERCVRRVREVHAGDDQILRDDPIRQDSIVLNIQRGCESAIDLAMHLVRDRGLGVPQGSRGAFELLVGGGLLDPDLGATLQRMVGFRNVAVHEYQALDLDIVAAIVARHLDDLLAFGRLALALTSSAEDG